MQLGATYKMYSDNDFNYKGFYAVISQLNNRLLMLIKLYPQFPLSSASPVLWSL
jgi:hypothetical protein